MVKTIRVAFHPPLERRWLSCSRVLFGKFSVAEHRTYQLFNGDRLDFLAIAVKHVAELQLF